MKDKQKKTTIIPKMAQEKTLGKSNGESEKVSALIQKYPDKKDIITDNYGKRVMVMTEGGLIDFNPEGYKDVVGAEKFTYEDYIDVQILSLGKSKSWFGTCYHNIPLGFKGCIEKKNSKYICFKCIFVSGMYADGDCFSGKEEHVWMSISGFEAFNKNDCVSFFAEVYRYVKTGKGKQIDFALRNPEEIEKIEPYKLPSDRELLIQGMNHIYCDTCILSEQCNGVYCLRGNIRKDFISQSVDIITKIQESNHDFQ